MTKRVSRNNRPLKLSFIDVKRHICAVKCCESCLSNLHPKQTKHRVLSGGCNEPSMARVNRYVRWNSDGERNWIEYEPGTRHAELIVKLLNLESAKGVSTPSVNKRHEEVLATSSQLDALQTKQFRSVVMRAAYSSHDRPDLSYSTNELARDM